MCTALHLASRRRRSRAYEGLRYTPIQVKHTLYIEEECKEDFFSYGVLFLINTRSLSAVCACVCRRCVRASVGCVCISVSAERGHKTQLI